MPIRANSIQLRGIIRLKTLRTFYSHIYGTKGIISIKLIVFNTRFTQMIFAKKFTQQNNFTNLLFYLKGFLIMKCSVFFDSVSHSTRATTMKVEIQTKCMSNDSNAKATCP